MKAEKTHDIEIISERFILKTITESDATPEYLGWLQGSVAKQYITYAENERSIADLRCYISEKSGREDVIFLGVFVKNDLLHIGNIKYEPVDTEKGYAVMGIMIGDEEWQGRGVGPEVIRASAIWLHQEKGIEQIVLGVNAGNESAIKAYKKVGFSICETPYLLSKEDSHLTMVWSFSKTKVNLQN